MSVVEDIAIVGYSFKLPQDINDDISFWDFPAHGGHFLNEDVGAFDAPFFSVTAQEAASMDPMQRWTLEESYRAFENAGIPIETLRGSRTAVFSASMLEDNARMVAMDAENTERTAATGHSVACVIPNRVSWYFDLRGPSIHVNTACSGSLSAIDMACKNMQSGDSTCALVTGSNLLLDPSIFQMLSAQGFLSPDSLCYSFDHRANGYARGEGTLALILKPVSAAIQNGDMIRAVIRASGSNQDGHTPVLTQPSSQSQEELIRHVYKRAGLSFDETRYVEAHGTGTPVGDPIEVKAIGRVFRKARSSEEPLYVGSVKANIGHLEGASALASLVKSILILEKGIIPPNALFEKINPTIDIPIENTPWPTPGLRRISVNSFGFGGSNTHVVLDDALHYMQEREIKGNHCTAFAPGSSTNAHPSHSGQDMFVLLDRNGADNGSTSPIRENSPVSPSQKVTTRLLVWSAADQKALDRTMEGYEIYYKDNRTDGLTKLDQLAFTLSARRSQMLWRTFSVVNPGRVIEAEKILSPARPIRSSIDPGIAFVFTGQGAQYVSMGSELMQYPVFLNTLREIDDIYRSLGCEWSIFDELHNKELIDKPAYSQPISTAIQLALVELMESFRITPKAVVGHSSGEIAAAYTIGALSLFSACKVAYFRGQLTGRGTIAPGAMLSINLADNQVAHYLNGIDNVIAGSLTVACINSPLNCTVSGPEHVIDAVKVQADHDGIFAHKLKAGVAYHSPAMEAISNDYLALIGDLEGIDRQDPKVTALIPMVSSVSGKAIRPADLATAQYWVNNLVSPVRFADAIQRLTQESSSLKFGMKAITDLVEIGPHPALKRPVNDTVQQAHNRKKDIRYDNILHRSQSALQSTLELVGRLFCFGHKVSLSAVNQQIYDALPPFLVDLPKYPFDRSNLYWAESRISRDFRLREPVNGETLGVRVADWNPLEPRWRNFLSVESTPWIEDHKISDTVLYPAAGMLVMAIEATQQMIPVDRTVRGYLVKQAEFLNPIIVPKSWEKRTETQVRLRPLKGTPTDKASSFEVNIFSYAHEHWTECCTAIVHVDYGGLLSNEKDDMLRRQYKKAVDDCSLPLDSQVLYLEAAVHGLQYGEAFQLLQDLYWDGKNSALARVDVSKKKFETSSLVHPAVLDQAFQVLRASAGQQKAANIPVRLLNAWFSASTWQNPQTQNIRWLGVAENVANGDHVLVTGERGSLYAFADDGSILCRIEQAIMATVSKEEEEKNKKLLYGIEWKPQLSLVSPGQLSCLFPQRFSEEAGFVANYTKMCSVLDLVCVRTVTSINRAMIPESLRRHFEWLEYHVNSLQNSEAIEAGHFNDARIEALLFEAETALPAWKLYTACARRLPGILMGQIDPLEVVFNSDLADVFYAALFENICADGRLAGVLDLAAHENPALRILEIGAGTGGMTAQVIAVLEEREYRTGAPSFAEYHYTDISHVFLERARTRWPNLQAEGRLKFQTLDIDKAIETQGLEPSSYDLVIAASVLHATPDLEKTIRTVRKTLKPGGRLILLEAIKPEDVATNFMAGLVPGWWVASEKWRPHSPAVSESVWDNCLRNNGFSGNDLVIRDYQNEKCHVVSIIVSTAVEDKSAPQQAEVSTGKLVLVIDRKQSGQQVVDLANQVCEHLGSERFSSTEICWFSAEHLKNQFANSTGEDTVICLAEVNNPLLATLSEDGFAALRQLTKGASKLLWVAISSLDAGNIADYSVVQGFLRSIRAEQPDSHIVNLNIEGEEDTATYAKYIATIFDKSFVSSSSKELEYVVRDGIFMTGRAVENMGGNKMLQPLLAPQLGQRPWAEVGALKLSVGIQGALESLQFVQDSVYETAIGAEDVEIEAHAWGLEERDVHNVLGQNGNFSHILGSDCAGVVTRVGHHCDPSIRPGDCVYMSAVGCMRKYPRSPQTGIVKIPVHLSFEDAVSIFHPAMAAYHALFDIARLNSEHNILIHSAASIVGQVAIRLAQNQGARVYATTASSNEKQLLVNQLGIPAERIFDSLVDSFVAGVMHETDGNGVDVVLNFLEGEEILRASVSCLAPGGQLIELSRANVESNAALPLGLFARNISFSAFDLGQLRPKVLAKLLSIVVKMVGEGDIQLPESILTYDVSSIVQAFNRLKEVELGRVVIILRPRDVVPQFIKERPLWKFDPLASYMIVGGFGGLGRAIMQWMADRGAKNLIIPSRTGAASKAAAEIFNQLTSRGIRIVAHKCDVSSSTSFSQMVVECAQTMPPIKGCINAAMVLQDGIFQENMNFAKWDLTMKSKIQTSQNLDQLLPDNLDFFVLLSSLAGVVGQMGSSNYAGGCSFQDALARHRVTRGERAVSIDIGWMRNIGVIAENEAYQRQRHTADDMRPIEGTDLLALLTMICDPNAPLRKPADSQILLGLRTPADDLVQGRTPSALLDRPLLAAFSYLRNSAASNSHGNADQFTVAPATLFRQSTDSAERVQIVLHALAVKLARIMSISPEDVEPSKPLSIYGVDSLMAVDLRNWIGREFHATVAVFDIMGGAPLASIAELVVAKSRIDGCS
ncbi:Acyl transferase/acyl hydrolase/lysophospholipase [Penicillium longicatenatum]|nr:Acyl transferase/acyl hydrolase/lysophospholipase [Penicillium longicatenatum]